MLVSKELNPFCHSMHGFFQGIKTFLSYIRDATGDKIAKTEVLYGFFGKERGSGSAMAARRWCGRRFGVLPAKNLETLYLYNLE